MRRTLFRSVWVALAIALAAAACGSNAPSESTITLYSGRSQDLIQPLLNDFTDQTGIRVEPRYGDSAELALLLQAEGDKSPADVVISQSPGALGLLAGEGRLAVLATDITQRVDPGFVASDNTWVGITGRVRVVVYNSELVSADQLPASVLDLVDPKYAGKVGVAPNNGSFQDFVTAMRNELGDSETSRWLTGMADNESPNYPKNSAIVEAVGRGEIDMGLVNHYYNLRALENDPSVPSINYFLPADDVGSLVIVTGGAVLASSDSPDAAQQLLVWLLSDAAQAEFAAQTQEYPLVEGIDAPAGLPPLGGLAVDTIDYALLGDGLSGTIELIRASGIER